MCLITDYSPENLVVASAEQHTSAVVEVATAENREESSYLSTYWAKRDEMHCGASHTGFGELEGEDPESGNGIAGLEALWALCCWCEQDWAAAPSPASRALLWSHKTEEGHLVASVFSLLPPWWKKD